LICFCTNLQVSQSLKVTQKSLILQHCERSELRLFENNNLNFTSFGAKIQIIKEVTELKSIQFSLH